MIKKEQEWRIRKKKNASNVRLEREEIDCHPCIPKLQTGSLL